MIARLKLKNKHLSFCLISLNLISFISNAQIKTPQIDDRIMIYLADHRSPGETETMMFLSNTFKYGEIGIPAGLFIGGVIGNNKEMRQNSLYVASSTAISYGLTLLIKQLVKRPRPFVQNMNIVPVSRPSSSSFPSGHTSTTFASATALSVAYPKWYVIAPAFLWAGSVGYSRMYLGVHYPTDVAAGAILGSGTSILLNNLRSNK
jgi:undecaprenyl-diphosphatase